MTTPFARSMVRQAWRGRVVGPQGAASAEEVQGDDLGRLLWGLCRVRPGVRACNRPPPDHDTRPIDGRFSGGDSHPSGARRDRGRRDPGWRLRRRARETRIRARQHEGRSRRSQIGMVVRAGAPTPDIGSVEAFRRTLLAAEVDRLLGQWQRVPICRVRCSRSSASRTRC